MAPIGLDMEDAVTHRSNGLMELLLPLLGGCFHVGAPQAVEVLRQEGLRHGRSALGCSRGSVGPVPGIVDGMELLLDVIHGALGGAVGGELLEELPGHEDGTLGQLIEIAAALGQLAGQQGADHREVRRGERIGLIGREAGTARGESMYQFAELLELLGHGGVLPGELRKQAVGSLKGAQQLGPHLELRVLGVQLGRLGHRRRE